MKILFTGATGVLGTEAVPRLVADGHDVTGVSRSDDDRAWLEDVGARPARVDLFDPESIDGAMAGMDTVVHYATAIPELSAMAEKEAWTMNDRLRSEATRLLVDAAISHSVRRFIQQSITFTYADGGDEWLDESSEIAPAWEVLESAVEAERQVDRFRAAGGTGITLRLSRLYGPGEASREYMNGIAARKIPIVGNGRNYVSSLHVSDAALALSAAMRAPDGVYNVTDDDPVTSAEYTKSVAEALRAPRPRRVPAFVGRLALGEAVKLLTTSQRVSNRAFRESTGWAPAHPSVRQGWPDIVAQPR